MGKLKNIFKHTCVNGVIVVMLSMLCVLAFNNDIAFIDVIDDVLENSDANGVDEVITVIEHLKKSCPELFKK